MHKLTNLIGMDMFAILLSHSHSMSVLKKKNQPRKGKGRQNGQQVWGTVR
jgi:hypothetical protein